METSFSFSDNTVGFFFDGVVDQEKIQNFRNTIEDKFERYNKINIYLEDNGIEKFTLPAILDEIAFKFKNSNKLHKIALVTDIKWIHACAALENLILPTTIKSFSLDKRMDAMSWISS